MSSRRSDMDNNPFEREPVSLERLDAELFGDLDRIGRPVVLNLNEIRTDGGTQPRALLDEELIAEYVEAIQGDAVFPPVDVFYDGENYWLADGFHRWHAHDRAGKETIRAVIHQGTQRAAILFSTGVNAEHGKRRTNEDKRRAVMTLLRDPEWSQWVDREIARRCKVHHQMVGRLRASLDDSSSENDERTYVTKHGTVATMKTGGIREANRERASAAQPEAGHKQDAPPHEVDDDLNPNSLEHLSARIVDVLARHGAVRPNSLRQAVKADFDAFNKAIDDLLTDGVIERVKDVQSGFVSYVLVGQVEDAPPSGVSFETPESESEAEPVANQHAAPAERFDPDKLPLEEQILHYLYLVVLKLDQLEMVEEADGLEAWRIELAMRWGLNAEDEGDQ